MTLTGIKSFHMQVGASVGRGEHAPHRGVLSPPHQGEKKKIHQGAKKNSPIYVIQNKA